MPSQTIQWFPGHMAKSRRMIQENLSSVDIILELCDARIPYSSRNPALPSIIGQKPRLTILTKTALADPDISDRWRNYYNKLNINYLFCDCITGAGINLLEPAIQEILFNKINNYNSRGMSGRALKAMVVGIPNVGKSSLINKLAGAKKARVEDRPGVTRDKQWIKTKYGIDLLDTPGVLWPKFEDRTVGENLAITGAVKDAVIDIISIAVALCGRLRENYPKLFAGRYKLGDLDDYINLDNYDLFLEAARKRGFIMSGGRVNEERAAAVMLDEFRSAKIGRISLELPK